MIGEHTVKSQRPRSVHDTKALQEQAESAKFMAQTGNTIVMFLDFILLTKLNFIMHALSCTAPFKWKCFALLFFLLILYCYIWTRKKISHFSRSIYFEYRT